MGSIRKEYIRYHFVSLRVLYTKQTIGVYEEIIMSGRRKTCFENLAPLDKESNYVDKSIVSC